ncbi:Bifunctional ATP-dependent dihydroxyacetone kinase/FAD-AMP lyase [Strongyloides ratti]|uniref:Triokinase/FMN cyclase n=1 Tax=Strongyloides ratti TaxID=34506 RepID=A0A090LJY8_STRRB|nr:Bifunctional ATP-dependent dihydroxyacetone kinase/FAD-AMP lyase [Strongyloides ratti]CEF70112.1 Bifunctional ATP-dependent dihydroxyacetone kinase/FAD-AMP lyase [Strongyloides ratti]
MGKIFDYDVNSSIDGLLHSNEHLTKDSESLRIITRKDKTTKTALLSGGGSGHEPFAGGLVGLGGLTGAVIGDLFTSPSIKNIIKAIDSLKEYDNIIVFVLNYTGDILNFTNAIDKYTGEKNIYMIIIDDDITHENLNLKTGRRGIAGSVLLLKIAGNLVEKNLDCLEIVEECRKIVNNMASLGVCEVEENILEIGLGIHREPGFDRINKGNGRELINKMLIRLLESERIKDNNSKKIVYINNLGGMSELEAGILKCFVVDEVKKHNIICGVYYGRLMTSLSSNGFSLTVLNLENNSWLEDIDKEYESIPLQKLNFTRIPSKIKPLRYFKNEINFDKKIEFILINICDIFMKKKKEINQLDKVCGDGDCGDAFERAAIEILKRINECSIDLSSIKNACLDIADVFEDVVGGTTGALYSVFLSSASRYADHDIIKSLEEGVNAIIQFGGAQPGDRTMIDPLYKAIIIAKNLEKEEKNKEYWEKIIKNVEEEVSNTSLMKAMSGRASYTNFSDQKSVDAGAFAVYLWMKAIYDKVYVKGIF